MKMYDNILQKVNLYEEKRGIVYAKTDGKLYKTIKAFYVLAFVYTMFMNLVFILGVTLDSARFEVLANPFYTVVALTVGLIAALVIVGFKKYLWAHIVSFALNLLSTVGLTVTFAKLLEDVIGYKTSFYWRHLAPLAIILLLSLWMTIIAIKAIVKLKKTYKKIEENLYADYSAESENLTDEEWDDVLKNI
jgi:hypothetical protein